MSELPNKDTNGKKIACGICGILIGAFGIHKFILGYTKEGLIMLLVSLVAGSLTCGVAAAVMGIIGLIEGIMYITKSDDEFYSTYIAAKKGWF
ncbi:MAG: NINE protein [Cyanobacteria bacterium J06623_7]